MVIGRHKQATNNPEMESNGGRHHDLFQQLLNNKQTKSSEILAVNSTYII